MDISDMYLEYAQNQKTDRLRDLSSQQSRSEDDRASYDEVTVTQGRYYEDEPIRFSSERQKQMPPKEYRQMRELATGSVFNRNNDAKIFYLQAKFMESFEDDCPYDRPVLHYYPSYQSLTLPELRGYFTWRARLREGNLENASLTYAFLYVYELIHQIGVETKEEGFHQLQWFCAAYGALNTEIVSYTRRWITDYVIYYNLPVQWIRDLINVNFDEALLTLQNCATVEDSSLFVAIQRLSPYDPEKAKGYTAHPDELKQAICAGYRQLDERYRKRYHRPYTQMLFGSPSTTAYFPFRTAVFYDHIRIVHTEYRISSLQVYVCDQNKWYVRKGYQSTGKSRELGVFVRAADRLLREEYDIKPGLKSGTESKTIVQILSRLIHKQRKAAQPKVEFDLSKLSGIRQSAESVGQRLMTDEERFIEKPTEGALSDEHLLNATPQTETPFTELANTTILHDLRIPDEAHSVLDVSFSEGLGKAEQADDQSAGDIQSACPLSGNELHFLQLLLNGGDWSHFLTQQHLMLSVLAESINEQLYGTFADTVIDFDGDTPVVVEDYLDDLKGMIPT